MRAVWWPMWAVVTGAIYALAGAGIVLEGSASRLTRTQKFLAGKLRAGREAKS